MRHLPHPPCICQNLEWDWFGNFSFESRPWTQEVRQTHPDLNPASAHASSQFMLICWKAFKPTTYCPLQSCPQIYPNLSLQLWHRSKTRSIATRSVSPGFRSCWKSKALSIASLARAWRVSHVMACNMSRAWQAFMREEESTTPKSEVFFIEVVGLTSS